MNRQKKQQLAAAILAGVLALSMIAPLLISAFA